MKPNVGVAAICHYSDTNEEAEELTRSFLCVDGLDLKQQKILSIFKCRNSGKIYQFSSFEEQKVEQIKSVQLLEIRNV